MTVNGLTQWERDKLLEKELHAVTWIENHATLSNLPELFAPVGVLARSIIANRSQAQLLAAELEDERKRSDVYEANYQDLVQQNKAKREQILSALPELVEIILETETVHFSEKVEAARRVLNALL